MGQACMYRYNYILIELNCNTIGKETKCIRRIIYSASKKVSRLHILKGITEQELQEDTLVYIAIYTIKNVSDG